MYKRDLEKLRMLNATPAMINALKEPGREKHWYDNKTNKYKYHLAARCQNLEGMLKVSICTREDIEKGILSPKWDIFINYEGDEYITRERQQDGTYKWREAYIYNLEDGNDYWSRRNYDHYMYFNPGGKQSIKALLKTEGGGFEGIRKWQEGCKRRREDARLKKLTDQWDEEMSLVKELPKGFEDWWHHKGFSQNYIFYKGAGAKEGFCTSCIKKISLKTDPKHNIEGKCPVCHSKVTYISRAKKTTKMRTWFQEVSCLQKYKDGFIKRDFSVRRTDIKSDIGINKSEFKAWETQRTIITDDGCRVFVYGDFKRRGNRWFLSNDQMIRRGSENMFPKNLSQVMKRRHTAYPIARKNGCECGITYFLAVEKKYPVIEMVYKAGLYALGNQMIDEGYTGLKTFIPIPQVNKKDLPSKLGIDRARMARLKAINGKITALLWLQHEKEIDTIIRDEDIMLMDNMKIQPETIKKSNVGKLLSISKICNYLRKQISMRDPKRLRRGTYSIWTDWNDYVDMMKKLKMDTKNELLLKPKDITIAHNELVARLSMKESKKEIKAKEKKFKTAQELMAAGDLKKYEYEGEKYCIIAPEGIEDIYKEGLALKHCIHTCDIYFQRIDIKETYLLFLRRTQARDTPWYTLEIEPGGNIRQKKSVLNEAYSDLEDAMPFLKEWQQWVKKNLSKEDKELAKKSDKARRDGYAKLRADKKIIWHGRLQGTLLVDALEDDFMEV